MIFFYNLEFYTIDIINDKKIRILSESLVSYKIKKLFYSIENKTFI